jgi:hypothetical protein
MKISSPIYKHRLATKKLATSLNKKEIFFWLTEFGYFPECYVLPPCFQVAKRPNKQKVYFKLQNNGKYSPIPTEYEKIQFPKTELTDRTFGIIHPEIFNDIAFHVSKNWAIISKALFPKKSKVTSYSFPIPINKKNPGRVGFLRSGRMIYEFIEMIDNDIASIAYQYTYITKTDIKNYYPSIYTHSIPWAIHGKSVIRSPKKKNLHNYKLVGNRLDKLFQCANDGCTNGIPIGSVVSDLVAEIIASGVDKLLSKKISDADMDCEVARFKDDYRILTKSESDAKSVIKFLQAALKEFNLELNDEKTIISLLPDGLFRDWVSMYHSANQKRKMNYSWNEFRELYLSVLRIDKACPGTGVIDRFLADIVKSNGVLRVSISPFNLQKVISMLLMLGILRTKAFPKIIAILEAILGSPIGHVHGSVIYEYLESYLYKLSEDEERNKYLISWISYFLVSNKLENKFKKKPKFKDIITRSIFNNRGLLFKECKDFKLFIGCKSVRKKITMLEYLDVFNPPKII